jgi:integrase
MVRSGNVDSNQNSNDLKRTRVGERVTIYPRGKSQIYVADFWHNNKHHRISLKSRNKKVATQRAVKLDAALADGTYKDPPPPTTIQDAVAAYIEFLKIEGRARKTIVRYQGELTNLREFLETIHITRLSQITPTVFDRFRAHCKGMGHGPRTMFHESIVVKQFLKWCRRRHLVGDNALADYKLNKPIIEPRGGPSLDGVNKILEIARGMRQVMIAMLAFTGMRSGECQRLRLEDVDYAGNWIHVVSRPGAETKTRRSRKVPIHPRLRTLLETMPTGKRTWFFTAAASPRYPEGDHWMNPKWLNEDFLKLLDQIDLPSGRKDGGYTVHSLRHFFKTYCINSGVPKPVVDTWQGHDSKADAADQYYRLSDEDSQRLMARVPFGTG